MHEMSLAISIYETCRNAVRDAGEGRLESVKVAVGELSAVEPELLEFAWEAITKDTEDEGSRLEIEWRPARQYCTHCGHEKPRPSDSWLMFCPDCTQPLRVDGGYELDVLQLRYLAYDEAGGAEEA